jgi:hypothetical protein
MTSPRALTLCARLDLPTKARHCGKTLKSSHRAPVRDCTAPDCDCGPSWQVVEIEDALKAERQKCATTAAIHSQYPITSEFDRGYAQGRRDAAAAIRAQEPTI